jgi:hypothetical protein
VVFLDPSLSRSTLTGLTKRNRRGYCFATMTVPEPEWPTATLPDNPPMPLTVTSSCCCCGIGKCRGGKLSQSLYQIRKRRARRRGCYCCCCYCCCGTRGHDSVCCPHGHGHHGTRCRARSCGGGGRRQRRHSAAAASSPFSSASVSSSMLGNATTVESRLAFVKTQYATGE